MALLNTRQPIVAVMFTDSGHLRTTLVVTPIWLAAGDVRPDAGVRAQISADTTIDDQSAGLQPSSRRVTVAERPG
jgi:hypothetical protein